MERRLSARAEARLYVPKGMLLSALKIEIRLTLKTDGTPFNGKHSASPTVASGSE